MEAELGVLLFERVGRSIALTEAGQAFLEETRAILGRVQHAKTLMQHTARGASGRLNVGFTLSASFHPLVPSVLKIFRQAWPGVELILTENHTEQLMAALAQGDLDLSFVRPPLNHDGSIHFQELVSEAMVVAVPAGHRLAKSKQVTLADLAQDDFIVYPRKNGTGLSDCVVAACAQAGFTPRVAQRTPQLSSTINLVAASLGIAVVPECMRQLCPEGVKYLRLLDKQPRAQLGLASRRDNRFLACSNFVALALALKLQPDADSAAA